MYHKEGYFLQFHDNKQGKLYKVSLNFILCIKNRFKNDKTKNNILLQELERKSFGES